VLAMRNGAFDYLQKPFKREELVLVVNRALSHAKLEREVEALKGRLEALGEADAAQSHSPAMLDQMNKCRRAAATDATVMVLGRAVPARRLPPGSSTARAGARTARLCPSSAAPCGLADRERAVRL